MTSALPVLCCAGDVQLPTSSRSGDNWIAQEYTSAISAQQNFELQLHVAAKQQLQQQQGSSLGPAASSQQPANTLMQAQFRCAANTGLDSHMLLIGIPNFLPNVGEGARSFYFVTLRDAPRPSKPAHSTPSTQLQREASGASSGTASSSSALRPPPRRDSMRGAQFSLLATDQDPMPDIKLGPLLGKGAFGRVVRGARKSCCSACDASVLTALAPGSRRVVRQQHVDDG
jgi:hypothetical protein